MWRSTQAVRVCAVIGAAALACASSSSNEKGRLVPLDLPREKLAQAQAPKRLALVVGIMRFDDPGWRALRFPDADAAAMADVLRDPERGAFDAVEVIAGGPTRDDLRAALRRLTETSRDERDTVVVYVSSHGTLARDRSGQLRRYLVTRDTRLTDVPGTALGMDEIKREFDSLRSLRKVLVLATCHSGSGKSLLPQEMQAELAATKAGFFVRPLEDVSKASVVLAASDWGETAREDEKLGSDVYTHFLVEALRLGADRNGDGAVTASEAHDYARRMTYEYTGGQQRPSAESNEVGADPIVLVGKVARRGKPEIYSYAAALDGFTVRVDGKPLAELPGGVALEPGRHRLQVSKGGGPGLVDSWLRLGEGERVDVAHLVGRGAGRCDAGPRLAFVSFLDARSRRDVAGAVHAAGAVIACAGWPAEGMALRADVSGGTGTGSLEIGSAGVPFRYSVVTAGVALPWRLAPPWLRGASLLAGPRLSALWLERRFDLELVSPQSFFTLTPGLLLGASVPLGRVITLGAEAHLDWAVVRVDGENRSGGLCEVLLGGGVRF